jgi:tetratricopeptide (TPR) repeat protein
LLALKRIASSLPAAFVRSEIASTHINRSIALRNLNQFAEAELALETARAQYVGEAAHNQTEQAKLAYSLGITRALQQRYDDAIEPFENAIDRFEKVNQPAQVLMTRLALALAQVNSPNLQAVAQGGDSLRAMQPFLASKVRPADLALAHFGLATAYHRTGKPKQAHNELQAGMALAQRLDEPTLQIQGHVLEATLAEQVDDAAQARLAYEKAMALVEAHECEVRDDEFRASWLTDKLSPFWGLVRLAWQQADYAHALEIAQRAKSRELRRTLEADATATQKRVATLAPELAREINHWQHTLGLQRRQMRLARVQKPDALPDSYTHAVGAGATIAESLAHTELQLRYALSQAQGVLQPSLPLIEDWRVEHLATTLNASELLIEYLWGEGRVWVWAVSQHGLVAQFEISDVAALADHCERYLQSMQQALGLWGSPLATRFASHALRSAREAGAALFQQVLAPLLGRLQPNRYDTLVIAADGRLNQIPFHALPTDSGKALLHEFVIRYVSSARLAKPATVNRAADAIGIAGAEEHAVHTESELGAFRACFSDARRFDETTGDWATVSAALGQSDWIHIASHAEVHPRSSSLSSFALGRQNISAAEVEALALREACVVLSACATSAGHHLGSDVFSLARAFMAAGATTLVTSLWRVADDITANLMRMFYDHVAQGKTVARALRLAQLQLQTQSDDAFFAHPALWAPLIVFGADTRLSR